MNARVNSRIEGAVGWLIFDNAPRRNAVTYEMWRAIPEVLERLSADPDIRIVVLRGAGDATFVSGADVSEFDSKRTGDGLEAYDRVAVLAQESLYGFKKPLIAMLRGFCIGGCFHRGMLRCAYRVGQNSLRDTSRQIGSRISRKRNPKAY